MKRGDIWVARLGPPAGTRPVVLLSRTDAIEARTVVIIAPVTTRVRRLRVEIPVGQREGLRRESVINVDTLETLPKTDLVRKIGELASSRIPELDRALRFALGISN